ITAEAAAMAATTGLSDDCGPAGVTKFVIGHAGTCDTTIVIRVADSCGNQTDYTYNTRVDGTAPTATQGAIAACHPDATSANTAALAATTGLTDDCGATGVTKTVHTSAGTCDTAIVIRVQDSCGNFTDYTYTTRVDGARPRAPLKSIPSAYADAASAFAEALAPTNGLTDNCGTTGVTKTVQTAAGPCDTAIVIRVQDSRTTLFQYTYNTRVDGVAPTATQGTIAACYADAATANAAALAATTALTDNCGATVVSKTVQTRAGTCDTAMVIRVQDSCGNFTDYTYNTRV